MEKQPIITVHIFTDSLSALFCSFFKIVILMRIFIDEHTTVLDLVTEQTWIEPSMSWTWLQNRLELNLVCPGPGYRTYLN